MISVTCRRLEMAKSKIMKQILPMKNKKEFNITFIWEDILEKWTHTHTHTAGLKLIFLDSKRKNHNFK